jgi:hypothetical protein
VSPHNLPLSTILDGTSYSLLFSSQCHPLSLHHPATCFVFEEGQAWWQYILGFPPDSGNVFCRQAWVRYLVEVVVEVVELDVVE